MPDRVLNGHATRLASTYAEQSKHMRQLSRNEHTI